MTRYVAFEWLSYNTWRMRLFSTLLVVAALAGMPGQAAAFDLEESLKAQHPQYAVQPESRVAQSDGMSLSQAIQSVKNRTGGKVISAETRVKSGREVHYIKVLKDGKVKTHKVNGRRR